MNYSNHRKMIDSILNKLKEGKPTIGTWMQIPSTDVAEIIGKSGYDWAAVDVEHGGFSIPVLKDILRALELGGTVPFVRVARCHPVDIKQALDAGAYGLILPMIDKKEQLEKGVSWAYYPPRGTRGIGYSRANLFGKYFEEYFNHISSKILIIAQIEHVNAVNELDGILSVDGLDAIMVGPYDLSGSMNLTSKFNHPDYLQVMDAIHQKANNNKVPMGLHITQPDNGLLANKITEGYQFIAYGGDAVFLCHSAEKPRGIN